MTLNASLVRVIYKSGIETICGMEFYCTCICHHRTNPAFSKMTDMVESLHMFIYSHLIWLKLDSLVVVLHPKYISSWNDIPSCYDDVIKWKHLRYWSFVREIHRSPVNSPHKGQWQGALMISLIYAWTNGWVINRDAGDLGRYRAHYDVTAIWNYAFWLTSSVIPVKSMSL